MAYDGSLNFDTRINTKGFNKDVSLLGKSVKKLGVALAAVFGTRALINFGKQAIQVASDLQEVQNVVDVAFGSMAQDINDFAKTALDNFGLSELSAKRYASSLGAMGASMGFAAKQNTEMAKTVTALVGDFASFYNVQQDMAATALNAIWTGETETLKRYGILITEVNLQEFARRKGIDKSIAKMTQQEKVMLRYNYVMEATKNAQGDFLRTQDSWANQTRILTERWKQFLGLIGQNLINVFTPAVKMLNNLLSVLIAATEQFNLFYATVTGKQIEQQSEVTSGISDSVDEQNTLTDSVKKTNKELRKSVAAFDEVNVLQKKATSEAENGIGGQFEAAYTVKTELDTSEVEELNPFMLRLLEILEDLQSIDLTNLNGSLDRLNQSVKPLSEKAFNGLDWAVDNVFIPLSEFYIEDIIPEFFDLLSGILENLNINLEILKPLGKWFWEEFLKPMGEWTGGTILLILQQINSDLEDFNNWMKGEDVKQENVFTTAKKDARELGISLKPIMEAIVKDLLWFKGEEYRDENVFTTAKKDAKSLEDFIEQFTKDTEKNLGVFAKWIEENVINPLDKGFWNLWNGVFINQNTAFNNMSVSITNFINAWIGKFENFFNAITKGINDMVDKLNAISFSIPSWVPEIGGREFSLNLKKFAEITLPKLAAGNEVPLGAQIGKYEGEYSTTKSDFEALAEEIRALRDQETVIKFEGTLSELARVLNPALEKENARKGTKLRVVTE